MTRFHTGVAGGAARVVGGEVNQRVSMEGYRGIRPLVSGSKNYIPRVFIAK
jgi:hypothetical protein